MSLAKSACNFYQKYKKQLALFVLVFFVYRIFVYYFEMKEGYSNTQQCSAYQKCNDCVKNFNAGDPKVPCWWSNDKDKHGNIKGCSAFYDKGYYRTCDQPPGPTPPGPTPPGPTPTKCESISNCNTCINTDCFWGDTDQKCSTNFKTGYGKICSGSNPNPNCPKCDECPDLIKVKTPTFITVQ